jgi:hypothetical protein
LQPKINRRAMKIIGRKEERRELERLTNSGMPEFVAVV